MFQAQEAVTLFLLEEQYSFYGTIHYATERHIVIACARQDAKHCPVGTNVSISQAIGDSYYQFDAAVVKNLGNSIVVPIWQPQMIQRRRWPRIPCNMAATYRHLRMRSQGSKRIQESDLPARIIEISVGGAKAMIGEVMVANAPLHLEIQLNADDRIALEATALRCTGGRAPVQHEGKNLSFLIAIRFDRVTRMDQMTLIRIIQNLSPTPYQKVNRA